MTLGCVKSMASRQCNATTLKMVQLLVLIHITSHTSFD